MSRRISLPKKKPVVGLTFGVTVALEESKRQNRTLTISELNGHRNSNRNLGLQLNLTQAELNSYYRACVEELGLEVLPYHMQYEEEPEDHPLHGM